MIFPFLAGSAAGSKSTRGYDAPCQVVENVFVLVIGGR